MRREKAFLAGNEAKTGENPVFHPVVVKKRQLKAAASAEGHWLPARWG